MGLKKEVRAFLAFIHLAVGFPCKKYEITVTTADALEVIFLRIILNFGETYVRNRLIFSFNFLPFFIYFFTAIPVSYFYFSWSLKSNVVKQLKK